MTTPKQGIQLKQTQTLAVTPQMQQSLKILQCNRIELEAEIANMLDENIMLERLDNDDFLSDYDNFSDYDGDDDVGDTLSEDIPDSIDSDVEWEELYDDSQDYERSSQHDETDSFQQDWISDSVSFDERLESSIHLSTLSEEHKKLAAQILTYVDEHYFLTLPHPKLAKKLKTDVDTLIHVIDILKHLDPPGVGSQDIQECMLAQLHSLPSVDDVVGDAHDILTDYFSYIGQKDSLIMRRLRLDEEAFNAAMLLIRSLSPYPRQDDNSQGNRIRPDVFIHQKMGMYYASLNQDARHDIGINAQYAALVEQCKGDEKHYMKAQLQTAKFFLKALDMRHRTVLRVSNAIVMQQQEYFTEGDKALQPLLMKDIAELLNLAESTVSRAVNGKYMSVNQRLVELRHFFSSDLSDGVSDDGEVASSATAVKALVKELIDKEPPQKPLSDSKIEKTLQSQGINIARRTVAKYRESMGIPPTSKRKRRI